MSSNKLELEHASYQSTILSPTALLAQQAFFYSEPPTIDHVRGGEVVWNCARFN
jgi:hypothetical protein